MFFGGADDWTFAVSPLSETISAIWWHLGQASVALFLFGMFFFLCSLSSAGQRRSLGEHKTLRSLKCHSSSVRSARTLFFGDLRRYQVRRYRPGPKVAGPEVAGSKVGSSKSQGFVKFEWTLRAWRVVGSFTSKTGTFASETSLDENKLRRT